MKNHRLFLTAFLIFSACSAQQNSGIAQQPQLTPEAQLADTLTICLGQEPESLYLYAAKFTAALDILQAIYDGPFDFVNGQAIPVIIEKIPNFDDGSAYSSPIDVAFGDFVIDANGDGVKMEKGVKVFPSGCKDSSCILAWDGETALQMDAITAIFTLKAGVTWSDGQPVTAADSVLSYKIASDPITPSNKRPVYQTFTYTALSSQSIQWVSIPGLPGSSLEEYFWSPLPEHVWGKLSARDLLVNDAANRSPLGWGAYQITEWVDGHYIRLKKNPYYYRAGEGLPHFETLIFKIINPYGDTALSNLKFDRAPFQQFNYDVGEFEKEISENGCDLTTTTSDMRDQLPVLKILTDYFNEPAVKIFHSADTSSELLVFNLADKNTPTENSLGILAVRKAIALCVDREKAVKTLSNGLYSLSDQVLFQNKGQNLATSTGMFDPSAGAAILDEAGWIDADKTPKTPRIASGLAPTPDGKELGFTYLVEDFGDTLQAAEIFKSSLSECGIGLNLKAVPTEVYWNPADENSIFQGHFDLAQLTWSSPIDTPCQFFSSEFIPTEANKFSGINFSRFNNEDFNHVCDRLLVTRKDSDRQALIEEMETLINVNMPVFPLYSYSKLMVANKDFCDSGLSLQNDSELAGIEDFAISPDCR